MDLTTMSSAEFAKTQMQVNNANKKIGINVSGEKSKLGKDSFLKLLVTQLQHQDPTKPMEDKQFIAQMAQFSSLEQMKNLNNEMKSLAKSSETTGAYGILGKEVSAYNQATKKYVKGVVSAIEFNNNQLNLKIGDREIGLNDVQSVHLVDTKK